MRFISGLALLALLQWLGPALSQQQEEFLVHGPMDLHAQAMNAFVEMRKKNATATLSGDGEFLQRANDHAIKRMRRKPDDELVIRVSPPSYALSAAQHC